MKTYMYITLLHLKTKPPCEITNTVTRAPASVLGEWAPAGGSSELGALHTRVRVCTCAHDHFGDDSSGKCCGRSQCRRPHDGHFRSVSVRWVSRDAVQVTGLLRVRSSSPCTALRRRRRGTPPCTPATCAASWPSECASPHPRTLRPVTSPGVTQDSHSPAVSLPSTATNKETRFLTG